MRSLTQKFEQRKQIYSIAQKTKASKWNETEDYQLVRLLHKVIFSFCFNKKNIKIKGIGNYRKNNEIKISASLKGDINII